MFLCTVALQHKVGQLYASQHLALASVLILQYTADATKTECAYVIATCKWPHNEFQQFIDNNTGGVASHVN